MQVKKCYLSFVFKKKLDAAVLIIGISKSQALKTTLKTLIFDSQVKN